MSQLIPKPSLTFSAQITLTEDELRALNGIFGYDVEVFLKVFYEKMGRAYVQPFEKGVRSLHKTIREQTAPQIQTVNDCRRKLGLQIPQ